MTGARLPVDVGMLGEWSAEWAAGNSFERGEAMSVRRTVLVVGLLSAVLLAAVILGFRGSGGSCSSKSVTTQPTGSPQSSSSANLSPAQAYLADMTTLVTSTLTDAIGIIEEVKKRTIGPEGSPVTTPDGRLTVAPDLKAKIHEAAQQVASAARNWQTRPAPPPGFETANQKLLTYLQEAAAYMNAFDIAAQTDDPKQLMLAETQMQQAALASRAASDELRKATER